MAYVYHEEPVTIQSAVKLSGTIAVPQAGGEKLPAVLILAGSGQGDRDGNVKNKGLNLGLYKHLSDVIAAMGFVTLRYDKRGAGASEGDHYATGFWDLAEDAAASVRFLKSDPRVDADRIVLLGHSEGCTVAASAHLKESAAGLILLSGTAEPVMTNRQLEDALKAIAETKGFKGFLFRLLKVEDKVRKQNAKLWERISGSDEPWFRVKGVKVNAKWLREHRDHNILDDLRMCSCPVLAVTGSKDIQVVPQDAQKLAEAGSGESEWHVVGGVNHILRRQEREADILSIIKEYKRELKEKLPVDSGITSIVGEWLQRHF